MRVWPWQAPSTLALEFRPDLWKEVLHKLGPKYRPACQVPDSVLRGMTDLPGS